MSGPKVLLAVIGGHRARDLRPSRGQPRTAPIVDIGGALYLRSGVYLRRVVRGRVMAVLEVPGVINCFDSACWCGTPITQQAWGRPRWAWRGGYRWSWLES